MSRKKPKGKQRLTDWEWMTLVGAWRYYERRATIASATFPADIVERFWGSGMYSDEALTQIARQFAEIDHGMDGEKDWIGDKTIRDCDRKPWCLFYAFCKAWLGGFSTVVMDGDGADGTHIHDEPKCFHCDYTGRWYPVDEYLFNPRNPRYCAEEFIKEIRNKEGKDETK